jgi:deazaflavin-dependent oxidoreductase (nitroreductase family)
MNVSSQLTRTRPHGVLRWGLRLPIWLYRLHLGWLLGERFLLLTHVGRKSGRLRHTVIEVVHHDRPTDTYYITSGWGEKSDWYRNLQKTPAVTLHVGQRELAVTATRTPIDEATHVLLEYTRQHPVAFRELSQVMIGRHLNGTPEDCQMLAESVPVVALRPRSIST